MKVVVAVDSFKGSMSSRDAGNAVKEGVLRVYPDAKVVVRALADGGEGTVEALMEGLGGEKVNITVTGPNNEKIESYYGYIKEKNMAVIETAAVAGLVLVEPDNRNPLTATTYGLGEMIKDAVTRGCRDFILGLGGSATNDGGVGMLQALGWEFRDSEGCEVSRGAEGLGAIASISDDKILQILKSCRFRVACDVENPLCGLTGATYVYGAQKGIPDELMNKIDRDMEHYAQITSRHTGEDFSKFRGAGAAGGLGFAVLSFLHAELIPGIELILDIIKFKEDLKDADVLITGEGCLDSQTAMGKAPIGVARFAHKYQELKVLAFAGVVSDGARECNDKGIDAFFPIIRNITTKKEAMNTQNARRNLSDTVEQVFRIL